jgi:hypothetical protein
MICNAFQKKLIQGFALGLAMGIWAGSLTMAYAEGEDSVRTTIDLFLSQVHPSDTKSDWQKLDTDASAQGINLVNLLITTYRESTNVFHQIRLLDALAWFSSPDAVSFLKQIASSDGNRSLRLSALRALAISQGPLEQTYLSGFLGHSDPVIRAAVARSLTRMHTHDTDQLVSGAIKSEKDPEVAQEVRMQRSKFLEEEGKPVHINLKKHRF